MTEKYLMVSLEEKQVKKLAEVLSNETARRILDNLGDKEATASEISKALNIPISTVNYNLNNLTEADLIEVKEFKWSPKGREMDIYKLKKRYIIIAPGKRSEIRENLKRILPIGLIGLIVAGFIQVTSRVRFVAQDTVQTVINKPIVQEAGELAATKSFSSGASEAINQETINKTVEIIPRIIEQATNNGVYFFIGIMFALILYLIFNWRSKK